MSHVEITEKLIDQLVEEAVAFWIRLKIFIKNSSHATYSFLKRDVRHEKAVRAVMYLHGLQYMPSSHFDRIKKVVLERVEEQLKELGEWAW